MINLIKFKKILFYSLVIFLAIISLNVFYKVTHWKQYFVEPYGITKYQNQVNEVGRKGSPLNVNVSITLGTIRYDIPAAFLGLVGSWDEKSSSYLGPLSMYVKGTDFSPSEDEVATSPNKPIYLWIEPKQQRTPQNSMSNIAPEKSPTTLQEFDALVNNRPPGFGVSSGKLIRAPDLDQFNLVAYRNDSVEVYAGQRSMGGLLSFSCSRNTAVSICNIEGVSKLDEDVSLKYRYAKQYIGDWDRFDAGLSTLFTDFKHK